jgi:hypothetical protein
MMYDCTVEEAMFPFRFTRPAAGLLSLSWCARSRGARATRAAMTSRASLCLVVLCQLSCIQFILLELAAGLWARWLWWRRRLFGLEVGV